MTRRADTGAVVPSRIYLFKGERPFRLSPVDAMLPLRADTYYREQVWYGTDAPKVLEVTARDASHFILLEGRGSFDLPRSRTDQNEKYRLEAYHGLFFKPAIAEFTLEAEGRRTVTLDLEPIAPGRQENWLAADDHIHLMRAKKDDVIFLKWLQAEDLAVGNFLELQRQQHAAVQYAFRAYRRSTGAGPFHPFRPRNTQPLLWPHSGAGPRKDGTATQHRPHLRQLTRCLPIPQRSSSNRDVTSAPQLALPTSTADSSTLRC